ncbi:hypothetical protein [Dokdonia sp. PRO95]|uniref:hypothetical protein n=1 Tax=Dokdonia sp. PRO95 TaxID=1239415 RepID=UPI000551E583|nr:hypothetical protein [Dokdonia sp. PRO95]
MKKLMMMFLVLATISMSAQRGPRSGEERRGNDMTAEQVATLSTKKMTLALALDDNQSKKVYKVLLDQAEDRKAMQAERKANKEKPALTKEQRYAMQNERLDKQIAMQEKMQSILTEDQFKQFKRMNAKRKGKRGDKGKRGHKESRRGNK